MSAIIDALKADKVSKPGLDVEYRNGSRLMTAAMRFRHGPFHIAVEVSAEHKGNSEYEPVPLGKLASLAIDRLAPLAEEYTSVKIDITEIDSASIVEASAAIAKSVVDGVAFKHKMKLEAVGIDWDGTVKPIADLSQSKRVPPKGGSGSSPSKAQSEAGCDRTDREVIRLNGEVEALKRQVEALNKYAGDMAASCKKADIEKEKWMSMYRSAVVAASVIPVIPDAVP